jgi:8-oxo-dGTP pyrophosphatase MutT (NUDIX family)
LNRPPILVFGNPPLRTRLRFRVHGRGRQNGVMSSYPVSIKGVLFTPQREVVLMRNERDEWELPGGRIEPDETPPRCLAREIAEELSLQVEVGSLIDAYLFEVIPGKRVFICTYQCTLVGEFTPKISAEHVEIGLFAPDNLPRCLPAGYCASVLGALRLLEP